MIESTADAPTAESIYDRLVAHKADPSALDAVCLGLETLAADPASVSTILRIAADLRELDALQLLPLKVQRILQPSPIHQTDKIVDGRIHTVTEVRLSGVGTEQVFKAIFNRPWSWWQRGRISGWQRGADGSLRFVLWPAWLRSPARVGIELSPPERASETTPTGSVWTRVSSQATFFADFEGPGRYEILGGEEATILRSVWDGVARKGLLRLMPATMVLDVHVRAEAGTLSFPFPAGTGFPGLLEQLGARSAG